MPQTWKRLYFVHRSHTVPADRFAARWKQHSELGGQFPDLVRRHVRVRYCLALDSAELPAQLTRSHDGIGMLWLGSPQELDRPNDDPKVTPTMRQDELLVFEQPAFTWAMVVREEAILDGPLQPFVFLALFKRKDPSADTPFLDACRGLVPDLAALAGAGARISRMAAGTLVRPPTIDFDATLELWFDTREAALATVGQDHFHSLVDRALGPLVQPQQPGAAYLAQVCHERLAGPAAVAAGPQVTPRGTV